MQQHHATQLCALSLDMLNLLVELERETHTGFVVWL